MIIRNYPELSDHNGMLCSQWLPDGIKDAQVIQIEEPFAEVKLWFERFGYAEDNGFIKFDYDRREIDPATISRQGVVDAGPLFGLVTIPGLTEDELEPVIKHLTGDDKYIRLGKRVVTQIIYPPVKKILKIISVNYGQYWINTPEEWESRERSLGSYCKFTGVMQLMENNTNKHSPN